ncbi:MAG: hypothetical protein WCP87_03235, partial [Atribacterota bacterium]
PGIRKRNPEMEFVLILASSRYRGTVETELEGLGVKIEEQSRLYQFLHRTRLCISCSGTVTLEVALAGVPQIIVYRLSPLTYAFARFFLQKKVIGLPNIILGQMVNPELIQNRFNPEMLLSEVDKILHDSHLPGEMTKISGDLRKKISNGDTFAQVAEVIDDYL